VSESERRGVGGAFAPPSARAILLFPVKVSAGKEIDVISANTTDSLPQQQPISSVSHTCRVDEGDQLEITENLAHSMTVTKWPARKGIASRGKGMHMIPWAEDPNHSGSVTVCGGHLGTTPMECGFSDHSTR
jgi:hypothetical protein